MEESYEIIWRDSHVGRIESTISDMWYLDGNWVSNNSQNSRDFEKCIATFDARQIDKDPTKGTRVILKSGDTVTHALIYALDKHKLLLRRVIKDEAVQWLLKNVK